MAVTFDGVLISFYLNGRADGSAAVPVPLCTNDEPLFIGVDFPLTTEYWHGAIDELGIWNIVLSAAQIREVMNGNPAALRDGLVGYWAFDEGSGAISYDGSGHANNGSLIGDPLWILPDAPSP